MIEHDSANITEQRQNICEEKEENFQAECHTLATHDYL